MTQTRTFEWSDPIAVAGQARSQSGIEFLRSILGRERVQAAPVAQCLDFQLVEADPGRVVFELTPATYHYNPIGTVHGGVICTLCDSAASAAVHSLLAVGTAYTTLEVKVSFLRPATSATGLLRCEGTVLSQGSRVATAEARLTDSAGKLYAHATLTCLIMAVQPK
jgi:uncharacterized protein (TIGR00369 family)